MPPSKAGAGSKQSSLLGFFSKVPATQSPSAKASSTQAKPQQQKSAAKEAPTVAKAAKAVKAQPLETPPPSESRSSARGSRSAHDDAPDSASTRPPSSSPTYHRSSSLTTDSLLPATQTAPIASSSSDSGDLTPPPSSDADDMDVDEEEDTEQPLFRRRAAAKRPKTYAESDSEGGAAVDSDSEDDLPKSSKGRRSGPAKRARKSRDEDDFIVPDHHDDDDEELPLDAANASDESDHSAAEEDSDEDVFGKSSSKRGGSNATKKKARVSSPPAPSFSRAAGSNSGLNAFKMGSNAAGASSPNSLLQSAARNGAASSASLSHLTKAERRVIEEKRKKAENEQAYSFLLDLRDKDGNRPGDAEYDSRTVYIPKSAWKDFTPFEKQFWEIKQNHWDTVLFFQKGKFYELYEEDALIGHREFDLKLTDRVKMKMVGVPEASFDIFAAKFLALGYKVGRVDQTETAVAKGMRVGERSRGGGSEIVNRELRHVLTSGTIVDASSLPDDLNSYCVSIKESAEAGRNGPIFGVCTLDAATAEFNLTEFEDDESRTRLETLLRSLRLKEVLHEKAGLTAPTMRVLRGTVPTTAQITMLKPGVEFLEHDTTLRKLNALFNPEVDAEARLESLDPVDPSLLPDGIASMVDRPCAMSALGGMLVYLAQLNLDRDLCSSRNFNIFDPLRQDKCLVLDAQSLTHLNVLQNDEGTDEGTLHRLLNRAVTPFGKRLFKIWLVAPLATADAIRARQDAVEDLLKNPCFGDEFETFGKSLPDIERIVPRVRAGNCRPRDFTAVLKALVRFEKAVKELRAQCEGFETNVIVDLLQSIPPVSTMARELQSSFKITEDGSFTPIEGAFEPYDRAETGIAEVEAQLEHEIESYRKQLKLNSSKCAWKHLGTKDIFQIEVPTATKVPSNWTKLSGTKDRNRWYSPKVRDLVQDIKEARETRLAALKQFHQTLFTGFSEQSDVFLQAVKTVAEIDCLLSLAKASYAIGEPSCRPELVDHETALVEFEELRHPCIAGDNVEFIPNDIRLGGQNDEVVILTGGNMAGKSTTARTSATGVILAQLGCRVPAASARLSPVDRIASRMGANDQIFRNNSTFMVEMLEASRIINECTPRSLVIMDELGRGTSTFDGQAIAFAVLHHLVSRTRCLTFFLTHYTNLAYDFDSYSRVSNKHMQVLVDDAKREVIFTYRLVDGIAESSYGTQVAALAGVPYEICDRAAAVSKQFAEATKASQAEKNKSAIPLALLSDFVHLFKLAKEPTPTSSDRNAEAKALTTLSQLNIIRSQVAALANGVHAAKTASAQDTEMVMDDDEQEEPIAPLPPAIKKITTYAGRNRRAMTEDFTPRTPSRREDDDEAMQMASSSPILSSVHTPLFPLMRQAKPAPRRSQPKTASSATKEPEQLILDLGQRIRIRCTECDMQYDTSSAEDCSLHARHHERTVKGLDWNAKSLTTLGEEVSQLSLRRRAAPGKSVLRGRQSGSEGGDVHSVAIRCYDMSTLKEATATRKINELLQTVDEALGAAAVDVTEIQGCKVLVAICGGRAAGAAVVGRVPAGQAREVLPSNNNKENDGLTDDPTTKRTVWNDAGDAIFVSDALASSKTPPVGVFRIHVIASWRRTGMASALLDAAANNSVYGFDMDGLIKMYGSRAKSVAFSQPTEAGRKLAEAWIRKDSEGSARLIVFEA
uniref:DNA mismatch repair proteins mutS family domain-containing protein n=1 Tax=Kalmanozyma brasiliensis (strain GHG001) TaxID=1365824 RepID=V5EJI3_KALBG